MTDEQHDQLPTAASPAITQVDHTGNLESSENGSTADGTESIGDPTVRTAAQKRRRGSRGGRNRKKPTGLGANDLDDDDDDGESLGDDDVVDSPAIPALDAADPELPKRIGEGRATGAAAERALVRKPQIGDTRPAPAASSPTPAPTATKPAQQRGDRGRGDRQRAEKPKQERPQQPAVTADGQSASDAAKKKRRRTTKSPKPIDSALAVDLDADTIERRRGRERNGRPIGRYLMAVQVRSTLTQVAVLEGRTLIEHYVSRPADDVSQIHGNIYLGKVQNVLPGMEAAFVDIGTPKNAVLYRGDVQYDPEDIVEKSGQLRIEQMLRPKQLVLCQVTKNPISAKGARLTQEVSLPGRFVVLIPNSKTYGISKRLPDDVRKRLRNILDRVKPAEHGLIVRTAAENANEHELRADMTRLLDQWSVIEAKAKRANSPTLLYREPELAVRVIREEFNAEYRGVIIDDKPLFEEVRDYVGAFNPDLADRIEYFDAVAEGLPLYERQHIHEQLHKALDRKVWLPSGGSLIIEHTEALTVIDVNTGKNVGTSNLEETVFRNNLEAADEVAKQLRLRDIGGIVVIDFIDMEIKDNRRKVVDAFRSALARDKTRTQVFDISDLGLVEMTRKRIGEGLLVNFADQCPNCDGRGVIIDHALLE
jgi:ribonuclease E